jgi:hypothetical protein
MHKKDLPKHLRMLLYGKVDSDELTQKFERVLDLCGCECYDVTVMEDDKVIIVDISPCIQYIKKKGPGNKIYEVIPLDSPLQEFSKRWYYDKSNKTHAKETLKERRYRQSA